MTRTIKFTHSIIAKTVLTACLGSAITTASCNSSKTPGVIQPVQGPSAAEVRQQQERNRRKAIKLVEQGDDALNDGDLVDALEIYAEAAQTDDSLSAAWNNLGVALMQAERYADADAALLLAERADPTDPRPAFNRGLLNYERGYLRIAREFFDAALQAEPQYLPALWGIIKCDRDLAQTSRQTLSLIRRAVLLETDTRYVESLERMRIEIEDQLEAEL